MRVCSSLVLAAAWIAAVGPVPVRAQTLTLHYFERPPYASTQPDGSATGLVATPAAQALTRAGIGWRWASTPPQRQLALIQGPAGLHCGVGWFRSPSRAARGKFSRDLYRDQPLGAIVRPGLVAGGPVRAAELIAAHGDRLIVVEGFSYGATLDTAIGKASAPPQRSSAEPQQLVRMIAAGRAGWTFVAPEEARLWLAEPQAVAAGLQELRFEDAGSGQTRHLYCNNAVPDDWIERIDRALAR